MNIYSAIKGLCAYGLENNFFEPCDQIYIQNQLLALFQLNDYQEVELSSKDHFQILNVMVDYAYNNKIIISNKPPYSDNFESQVMNVLLPRPSEVIKNFQSLLKASSIEATEYFYEFSKKSHYIRLDRTSKNMLWQVGTTYGPMDITINLSKPEKDPKAIAAALTQKENNYPLCLLCVENEGYAGHVNHPGRQNHRIVPLTLSHENWFFQYSPYAYFNEHSILLKETHTPMVINHKTFDRLIEFTKLFPHYFIGSNADLPIVGGSMLTHDHYQCGCYEFAMTKAKTLFEERIKGVHVEFLKWPLSVLRLSCEDTDQLLQVTNDIFDLWCTYEDQNHQIIPFTNGIRHNTVTPIARNINGLFQVDLVLRNNRVNSEHPDGIFHPAVDVHPVKKENIGLIEVMGLAVLPSRLQNEISELADIIFENRPLPKHLNQFKDVIKDIHASSTLEETNWSLKEKVGLVFVKGLEDSGVFKQTEDGVAGVKKFISCLMK